MPISAHHNDPVLEALARGVYALFPRCIRCGWLVEAFEDADVQILAHRVVHRGGCPVEMGSGRGDHLDRRRGEPRA